MGPRRPERSKLDRRIKKLNADKRHKTAKLEPSAKELLTSAEAFLQVSDCYQALKHATLALEKLKDAINVDQDVNACLPALNLLGEINIDLGEIETARAYFEQAAAIDHDGSIPEHLGGGPDKFLWLAQLSEEAGKDSINWYEKAVEILRSQLNILLDNISDQTTTESITMKKTQLAHSLCAMTEVYMTDLSWEEDAESRCDQYTEEAISIDPYNPETLQTIASVRISQSKPEEACNYLQRSLDYWLPLPSESPLVPEFAARISLVRLLLEVSMKTEALKVLERLVKEDDHSVEAWYLGGWCQYLLRESEDEDPNSQVMKRARVWLMKCLNLCKILQYEDEGLLEHAQELIELLNKILGPPAQDDIDAAANLDWESASEDEDGEDDDDDESDGDNNKCKVDDG